MKRLLLSVCCFLFCLSCWKADADGSLLSTGRLQSVAKINKPSVAKINELPIAKINEQIDTARDVYSVDEYEQLVN
ncbi:hypothetical protein FACS1894122_13500 [Alphaproteobacteria bacterium]|nr:hypothetical protein FACS1894122_13500 [Alphaproteobacteria bacterium]